MSRAGAPRHQPMCTNHSVALGQPRAALHEKVGGKAFCSILVEVMAVRLRVLRSCANPGRASCDDLGTMCMKSGWHRLVNSLFPSPLSHARTSPLRYSSTGSCSVLPRLRSKVIMNRGSNLSWLSGFPGEKKFLYPPTTFLRTLHPEPDSVTIGLDRLQRH